MKLLADGMLGRLAKWLRILGYDTAYSPKLDDDELVRLARAEGRVLLTRDEELARRRGVHCFLVKGDELEGQIAQVIAGLGLQAEQPFSRCPVCNAPLQEVEKSQVAGRVPPHVFRTQERFSLCPKCGRIYWRGTHWAKMCQKIAQLRQRQGVVGTPPPMHNPDEERGRTGLHRVSQDDN